MTVSDFISVGISTDEYMISCRYKQRHRNFGHHDLTIKPQQWEAAPTTSELPHHISKISQVAVVAAVGGGVGGLDLTDS